MEESEEDADANILPQLLLVLVLTLVNAFLAMSELAVISCSKSKISLLADEGNKKAKMVQKLNKDQTKFLSTIQVGITLAGFFSSAVAAEGMSDDLATLLAVWGLDFETGKTISMVIITVILSLFTLIFGELFPKRIALANPEKTAMLVAYPINLMKIITTPFVKFLSGTCNLLAKITGLNKNTEEKVTTDEIKYLIESGVEDGAIDEEKQKMMESVLKFNKLTATDIMTPRISTYMIDINDKIEDNIKEIIDMKYSRIPVFDDDRDKIIGVLYTKDLLTAVIDLKLDQSVSSINLKKLLRKPLFVRERIKLNKLFNLMKKNKVQLAILLDEFGGVSGICTMEDIVEEVVGNIYDEYDDDEITLRKINEFEYIVDGTMPIQEVNRELDLSLDEENPNYDTIAGLIITTLEAFPNLNDKVKIDNLTFIVEELNKLQISKVRIKIEPEEIEEDE